MTYDPYRTNMLPDSVPQFPITDELPAVRGPGGAGSGRFFLKLIAAILIAGILAIAGILIIDTQRADEGLSDDQDVDATLEPTPPAAAPTAVFLEDGDPGYWQVVGVADGLNVRSGPGTDNDIVGVLASGQRHVLATGERATVNGSEWKQIEFDGGLGWVASGFLATDTEPGEDEPTPTPVVNASASVVCFSSTGTPARIARLEFTNRTEITGIIRTIGGQSTTDQTIEGTLSNGQGDLTLTDTSSNRSERQVWTFNPANVDIGRNTLLQVVDCGDIAGQLP